MYPFVRMVYHVLKQRGAPRVNPTETHVSHHYCLPWDLDIWMELNNGRTLTLYDLGRIPMAVRTGMVDKMRKHHWGMTIAGASVRYRRRIRMFEKIEIRTRLACWDDRFIYIEQSMWKTNGECANQIVYRGAVTDKTGIVPAPEVAKIMVGPDASTPETPEWIQAWIDADAKRPWPPVTY